MIIYPNTKTYTDSSHPVLSSFFGFDWNDTPLMWHSSDRHLKSGGNSGEAFLCELIWGGPDGFKTFVVDPIDLFEQYTAKRLSQK